ncbi:MAG: calcium-binding protein [Methyloceanibacter sp.]|uniref:calcium-binding protein n=1 Tax=Methyloceanibacter sp. TaxID=1965321 RepID=UPI003D6CD15F
MAVIDADITETVNPGFIYSVDDEQVTINAGILVESQQNDGVSSNQNGSIFINNGNVFSGNTGVDFTGANQLITNNATGSIVASDVGMSIESAGVTIINHGTIHGSNEFGVDFKPATEDFTLSNTGSIYGRDIGVLMGSDLDGGVISNSGLIRSDTFGIGINHNGGDVTLITNTGGTIKGTDAAIFILEGRLSLKNTGTIVGDIESDDTTGNVNDSIVNSGKILGQVLLGAGNDVFNGKSGKFPVVVFGEEGNDTLIGGRGKDQLDGGADNDLIRGGRGKDLLTGGNDSDLFDFNTIKDSLKGGKRDKILDFTRGEDDIDLKGIDAKTGVSGNQKFNFIGKQDFSEKKGELRYEDKGSKVIVQGDVNGDGKADFEIYVAVGSLGKGDFLL